MRLATDTEVEALVRDRADHVRNFFELSDEAQVSTTLTTPRRVIIRRPNFQGAYDGDYVLDGVTYPVRFEAGGRYCVESPYWRVKK